MRLPIILGFALLALLLAFAGCNKQTKKAENVSTAPAGSGATDAQPAAGDSSTAQPDAAGAMASNSAPSQPTAEPVKPADPVIGGMWFALFGRHGLGVVESEWKNGHRVRFVKDNLGLWIRVEDGWDVSALDCKYQVNGDQIKITFSPARAAELGLAKLAPLGIGRDEEIGLLASIPGRDEEIGLTGDKGKQKPATADRVETLKFVVDGNIMALTDSKQYLMVYARADLSVPEDKDMPVPQLGEKWLGSFSGQTTVPAKATLTGNELVMDLGMLNGKFEGTFSHGYFFGKVEGGDRLSLAALELMPDHTLNGVLVTDPYQKMDTAFDFVPAS